MTTLDTHELPAVLPSAPKRVSGWRLALFLIALVASVLVGVALPEDARPLLFWGLAIATPISIGIGFYRERFQPRLWVRQLATWRYWQLVERISGVGAGVAMAIAGYMLRPMPQAQSETGFRWFVVGLLLTGVTLLANRLRQYAPTPRTPLYQRVERWRAALLAGDPIIRRQFNWLWQDAAQVRHIRWRAVSLGVILIACVLQVSIFTPPQVFPPLGWLFNVPHGLQMLMLIGGALLVTWGAMGRSVATAPIETPALNLSGLGWRGYVRQVPLHRWALLAIIAAAIAVRLWDLEYWTTRFLDELHYMNAVSRLHNSATQQILVPFSGVTAFTWLFPYGQYLTTLITGDNFTGVRLLSAFFGVAQVGAVYFLGKTVFNRRVALVAAAFLATLPLHIHFSRIGIGNIADPFPGIMALAFLARGIKSGRQADFALAGFWLGWTQYFYEGGRLFYPAFTVAWLGWLLLFRWRGQGGVSFPKLRNLAVMLLTAAVLIIPVWQTLAALEIRAAPRFDEMRDATQREVLLNPTTSVTERLTPIIEKAQLPLLALVQKPDESWFFGGKQPFVLTLFTPFFLFGLALCVWRLRTLGGSLVFWWIAGACFGIALISDSLSAPRYLVMMPAVGLALGLGVVSFVEYLVPRPAMTRRLLFTFGAFLLVFQAGYYALIHVPNFYTDRFVMRDGDGYFADTDDALLRSIDLPPNTDVIILSKFLVWDFNMETVPAYWGREDIKIRHLFLKQLTNDRLRSLPRDRNYAFFLEQDDERTLLRLQRYFTMADDPTGNDGWSPYRLPREVQLRLYFAPMAPAPTN